MSSAAKSTTRALMGYLRMPRWCFTSPTPSMCVHCTNHSASRRHASVNEQFQRRPCDYPTVALVLAIPDSDFSICLVCRLCFRLYESCSRLTGSRLSHTCPATGRVSTGSARVTLPVAGRRVPSSTCTPWLIVGLDCHKLKCKCHSNFKLNGTT